MRRPLAVLGVLVLCGVVALPTRPAGAIVGGEEADPGEWPWQVALEQFGSVVCGGSLLAMDVVLTAAHCVEDVDAEDLSVRAGIVDLDDDGQELDVAAVHVHEEYDDEDANDVAVLLLDGAFEPGDGVEAVALPDLDTAAALTVPGSTVFVTGFGTTSEDGESLSDHLLEGEVEVVEDDVCRDNYEEEGDEVVPDLQVCAGLDAGGIDACFGDSGGPLVVPADDQQSGWYLLGVVSFGEGCGRPGLPTVYTEVAAFHDFLSDVDALAPAGQRFDSDDDALRLPAFGTRGKATQYPATITVRDAPDDATGVAVELRGLSHERPTDLDVWLRVPDGTVITLLSDVGGDEPVDGLEVVVETGGAAAGDRPLPLRVAPTDRQPDGDRKGARPVADLAALGDADLEGEWELLLADDRGGASGSLDGWTLVLG